MTSKFKGQEIFKIDKKKSILWIEILNESYFDELKIKNKTPIGFLVIEPENLELAYGRKKKPKKAVDVPKNWEKTWKTYWQKKKMPNRRVPKQV